MLTNLERVPGTRLLLSKGGGMFDVENDRGAERLCGDEMDWFEWCGNCAVIYIRYTYYYVHTIGYLQKYAMTKGEE